ncbi:putative peroxygenase 4-like isoform X1 [Hibiscus syriacus]|uniref:Peroxygenase 4-like isoform X1 n=1 Tax=Hibiscus syriacus TaxID=106335 RepID=A0A6A3BKP6_HIBSY|nr:putative peroxygenase 4-like isoform X1 [Hibiscus syriacus]
MPAPGSASQDTVYGLFQCRGDLNNEDCGRCVAKAMWAVISSSSDALARRDAVLGYLGVSDGTNKPFRIGGSGDLRGVAQCVGDLSPSECQDCLSEAIERLETDCAAAKWGDMYLAKCYARYSEGADHWHGGNDTNNNDDEEIEKTLAILIGLTAGVALIIVFVSFLSTLCEKDIEVYIEGNVLPSKDCFKYLGYMIHKDGDDDVTHRIKAGWLKWRAATGVLCDKKVSLKLKGKFYRMAIRLVLLYGSECWAIKKDHVRRMEAAEMRMLRWACGRTLWDMTPNSAIRMSLGVVLVSEKLREGRLRWFGHVLGRQPSNAVRRVELITADGAIRRGRPRRKWVDCLRSYLKDLALTDDMSSDRKIWRLKTRVAE